MVLPSSRKLLCLPSADCAAVWCLVFVIDKSVFAFLKRLWLVPARHRAIDTSKRSGRDCVVTWLSFTYPRRHDFLRLISRLHCCVNMNMDIWFISCQLQRSRGSWNRNYTELERDESRFLCHMTRDVHRISAKNTHLITESPCRVHRRFPWQMRTVTRADKATPSPCIKNTTFLQTIVVFFCH